MNTCECSHSKSTTARAIQLTGERQLALTRIDEPPAPAPDEIKVQIRAVALNHIDVWSWRGMAFAKRELPIILGAEASGEVRQSAPTSKGSHPATSSRFMARRHAASASRVVKVATISAKALAPCTASISTAFCATA